MRSLRSEVPPRPAKAGAPRPIAELKASRPAPRRPSGTPSAQTEPTVLLVGSDAGFEPALRIALARHRVYVETTSADAAVETVIVTAPDLVLLANQAAENGGRALLAKLAASPSSSVVPVAILDDNPALDQRLQAFRHGAAAVIPRSASIDAIAEQVARLAREIPERGGEALGQVGEATLAEFVSALGNELRSGILSVQTSADGTQEPVRLVLGSGRPLAAFIDDFVTRVRRHVVHAEPLKYEFDDRAGGTVKLLDPNEQDFEAPSISVKGLRIALADDDSARADSVAHELRSRGATVIVTDLNPSDARFARLRQVDPEVLIAGEAHLQGHGYELLRRMRRDTRLRWASLLVVRWEEIWSDTLSVPALDRLESALSTLGEADRALVELGQRGEAFDTRLEITGPARLLRTLVNTPRAVRLTVTNPRLVVSVDLSEGLVVGASAQSLHDPQQTYEGALALSGLLVLSSGKVQIDPVQQPAVTNVMSTIDVALNMADSEPAPIAPSMPAPHSPSLPPPPSAQPAPSAPEPQLAVGMSALGSRPAAGSARRRLGVTKPMAALLIGLACVQGLLIAWFLGSLARKGRAADEARALASASAPTPSASPAAPRAPAALPASVAAPAGAPAAPPSPAAPEAAAASEAAAAPAATIPEPPRQAPLGKDESGFVAPTCASLLDPLSLDVGNFPGAAYEQQAAGAKALVQGRVEEAQLAYCKAVRWDAKNPQAHIDLAQLFLIRKDGAAAAEEARIAVQLDPNSGRAQSLLGDGLVRIGDHEGARQAWLLAAGVDPTDEVKFRALLERNLREAEASLKKRDVSRAERFFRRAIVLDPDSLAASRGLAAALNQLGDGAAAVRWAQRALAREPRDPDAHVVLGDALLLMSDKVGAERAWREANRLDPSNIEAQRRIRRLRTLK